MRYIDNFAFGMDPNIYPGNQLLEKISMNPVTLGRGVLAQCNKLKFVDWGNRLQRIGSQCFQGCTELEAVDLPLSLDSIFGSAFHSCSKLESISNLENVRFISSYAFYKCESLKNVTIGCEVIGNDAFNSCTGLANVTLKDGVRIIGGGVFSYGVPLTSITIPQSVDSIGYLAFPIESLFEIKVYAQKPPVMGASYNAKVFSNYDARLYVPSGTLDAYKNALEWKRFKYIEEMDNIDGIHNSSQDSIIIDTFYDIQGHKRKVPNKGINVIRKTNGEVRKVLYSESKGLVF